MCERSGYGAMPSSSANPTGRTEEAGRVTGETLGLVGSRTTMRVSLEQSSSYRACTRLFSAAGGELQKIRRGTTARHRRRRALKCGLSWLVGRVTPCAPLVASHARHARSDAP